MKKVNILGTEYTINIEELEEGIDGLADKTSKKIKLDKNLDIQRKGDVEKKYLYKNVVMRHELLHAIFYESGMDCGIGNIHSEQNVDWLAMQYPKIKKIFKELNIEE